MKRRRWKKSRRGVGIPQTTPSFNTLWVRHNAGLRSQKEITRRVKDADPNALSNEERDSWSALLTVALSNRWVTKDEVPTLKTKIEE